MPLVFEHAAFTVRDGHEQALLDERPAMITALRRAFPGLVSSWLTRRDDGTWLDVILWRSLGTPSVGPGPYNAANNYTGPRRSGGVDP